VSRTIRRAEVIVLDPGTDVRWTDRAKSCSVSTTILRLEDGDGVVGLAATDTFTFGRADRSVLEAVRSMWPWLEGRTTDCRQDLATDMRVGVVFPFTPAPIALVDMALWDIAAKNAEVPLWRLLGGAKAEVPVYASLETMPAEQDYLDVVDQAAAAGIRAVKVHAFGDPDRDIALFTALRGKHPDLTLMHDGEGVYNRQEALRVGAALDELDFHWYEAPLADFDLAGYRDLSRRLRTPILPAGYAMWDVRQLADALRDTPWGSCRAEITSTLGITAMREMMTLAKSYDMNLEPVTYGHALFAAAGLQLMQGHANATYFELAYPNEPWEYGIANPIRPDSNGMVRAHDSHGIGLKLDWEQIDRLASSRITLGD
jgi:L-alanine-DL-glutamate epimerase-like enolase superfamily enzyme